MTHRIGILGGTFDPVHIGHLIIAEESRYRLDLEKVVFVPAGTPPHKPDEPVSEKEHRYRMTVLATEDNPAFEVSRVEIEREGPSYTVDTLGELRKLYGLDAELFLIMGADSLLEILTWHRPEEIVKRCRIVAAGRPGYDLTQAEQALSKEFMERVIFLEVPDIDISSTELRSRAAAGIPIKYLVPRAVEGYIKNNNLYGTVK